MADFHFKQAGVFHLKRLEGTMRKKYGKRYRLSDESSIKALIWDAIELNDIELMGEFTKFFINCWPETQSYICKNQLIPNLDNMLVMVENERQGL